jgi:rhamnosyltransferase subunit B
MFDVPLLPRNILPHRQPDSRALGLPVQRRLPPAPSSPTLACVNVLLFALGSHGDVHPLVGIGRRLRQRGQRVAVAANEYFQSLVEHAGLEFIQCGSAGEYTTFAKDRDLWHPMRSAQAVFAGTARYLRPMYELARDFAEARSDAVIVASSLALGARVAQDRHGIPLATVHLSPCLFQSEHELPPLSGMWMVPNWAPAIVRRLVWRVANAMMDSIIAPSLNALRGELGLPPVRKILGDYWHSPSLTLGLFPDWFARPQPDWPKQLKLTGFPLYDEPEVTPISPDLEAFLRAGEPPIAFTPGSAMWQAHRFFSACVETCVRLKRRGLLLTRHSDHLPRRLPDGVIHVPYAPFSQLLPRCAAFVHHGGIGSTAQALSSGVPQLVTPFTHDQPDNAERLKRLGVAEVIPASSYTADAAVPRMRMLMESPSIARACREVRGRFVGIDALGQTCDLIEALAPTASRSRVAPAA